LKRGEVPYCAGRKIDRKKKARGGRRSKGATSMRREVIKNGNGRAKKKKIWKV